MIEVSVLYICYMDENLTDLLFSEPVEMKHEMYPYTTDCTIGRATLESIRQLSTEFRTFFKIDESLTHINLEREDLKKFNDDILRIEIKKSAS